MTARSALIVALVACAAAGCGREEPSAPGVFSITGRVRLVGHLVDPSGRPTGTRVVHDADGVAVDLLYGETAVARATTEDGVYRFDGVARGGYQVRARVGLALEDVTRPLNVVTHDIVVLDTLRLTSRGDILPVPNPAAEGTLLYFELPDTTHVALEILDTGGRVVRVLADENLPPGLNLRIWNGRDEHGDLAGDRLYWATLSSPETGDFRAQLLFHEPE